MLVTSALTLTGTSYIGFQGSAYVEEVVIEKLPEVARDSSQSDVDA
jgi:hypothetical protein